MGNIINITNINFLEKEIISLLFLIFFEHITIETIYIIIAINDVNAKSKISSPDLYLKHLVQQQYLKLNTLYKKC